MTRPLLLACLLILTACSGGNNDVRHTTDNDSDMGLRTSPVPNTRVDAVPGPPIGFPVPTPTSTPVPTPSPSPESAPSATPSPTIAPTIQDTICAYSWDCAEAVMVASCETGGTFNPYATGHEDERGWFQIRFNHWDRPQCNPVHLYDPVYNTACAYSIWLEQGWSPWSCWWR